MSKTKILVGTFVVFLTGLFIYFKTRPSSPYDTFAQCLTGKGVKMYGAYWCPHCKEQKQMFGSSFKYVNYIECATPGTNIQNPICAKAKIKGYPTWEFADGSRIPGKLDFDTLSQKTNCPLPDNKTP